MIGGPHLEPQRDSKHALLPRGYAGAVRIESRDELFQGFRLTHERNADEGFDLYLHGQTESMKLDFPDILRSRMGFNVGHDPRPSLLEDGG